MSKKEVVIASAVRTPIGSFRGLLWHITAPQLGSIVIKETITRAGIRPEWCPHHIDQVIMGNVLSAGLGQAPARQAALKAGIPENVKCLTINKVCGSGLKAVMLARDAILAGQAKRVVAGGMENMSQAPYLIDRYDATGHKFGHGETDKHFVGLRYIDSLIKDGLWDSFNDRHMGKLAEFCAELYNISRQDQDEFAIKSYQKALKAQKKSKFWPEIAHRLRHRDQELKKFNKEKLLQLPTVFKKNGTVTPGNASSLSDGAAALMLMSAEEAKELGIKPMAKIITCSSVSIDPQWFTIAPVVAVRNLLCKTKLEKEDIDLFEINEAFSAASIAVNQMLGLDEKKVNVNGGAVALGHPIGATGARILVTLLYAMKDRKAKRGIASLCIGGGEGLAMLVERI